MNYNATSHSLAGTVRLLFFMPWQCNLNKRL